jgi:hypothetical protein
MFGEVVGINAMYLEGGESLNFAIPVNDAKSLLQNQSAQLQPLPNDSNAERVEPAASKSDAPNASPSNVASSEEDKRVAAILSSKEPSYYISTYQHDIYLIKYKDRQMLATCRESLCWYPSDSEGLGHAIHECIYIKDKVGKHIPAWQMWRSDKELRYEPFGHNNLLKSSAPVADVLDIIAEAPISSPLRRPTVKTSPEILKTLHWIQNTLADGEGRTLSSEGLVRDSLLDSVNGCQVTFVYYEINSERKITDHTREQVNLGDLDPTSLTVADDYENKHIDIVGPVRGVTVQTTDKVPAIRVIMGDRNWHAGFTTQSTDLVWQPPAPYAPRFAKALRQAITLCGGKRSSF